MKNRKHLGQRVLAAILAVAMTLSAGMVSVFAENADWTKAGIQAEEAQVSVPAPLALYDFEDFTAGGSNTLTDGERVLKLESMGGTVPALYQDAGHGQVLKLSPATYAQRAYALLPGNPFAGQDVEGGLTLNFWTNSQGDVVRERCLIDFEVSPAVNGKRAGTFAVNQLSSYWNITDQQSGGYIDFRYDDTIGLDKLNEWKMITMVVTTTGVTFYTNGVEAKYNKYGYSDYLQVIQGLTGTGTLVSDPSETNVRIGASLATYWSCANALIDDIAFYGEALTVEQIQSLYVVKDALRAAVSAEKEDGLKQEEFSEASWLAYAAALAAAENVLNDDSATQSEVDAALETLIEAREGLVLASKPVSLKVTAPVKTSYFKGDALDTTGLVVIAVLEDGSETDVTGLSTLSGYDANVVGTQKITVSYKDLTASFEVTVSLPVVKRYEAENAVLTSPAKRVSRADASGGYKVGTIDNADATVTFTVDVPADGTYRVDVAADGDVSAFPNSSHKYWINGDTENAQMIRYTKSTSWDTWYTYPIAMELKAGANTITFSHSGVASSYSELDYIELYTVDPSFTLTLDGEALEGFNEEVSFYESAVEALTEIPEVAVAFTQQSDAFVTDIRQGTEDRPEAYITIKSVDGTFEAAYQINFYGPDAVENPLVNFGADPYVTYQDGYYYYVRCSGDKSIWVTKTDDLTRIGKVEPVCVYTPSGNEPAYMLWAPEIHFIDGYWYIYYAGCTVNDNVNHRMCVIKSKTSDAQGEYEYMGTMSPTTDNWAIDQTVLQYNGKLYAVWSGWHYTTNVDQRIYIAEMSDPTTIVGERVELSMPEYNWEQMGGSPYINEGPQVAVSPDGTVSIVYSASGSWSDYYCLGMLTLVEGGDPMNAEDWIKSEVPIFEKNGTSTFSTGHACFVPSPDGTETYLVYHATRGSGEGWTGRGVRTQKVYWNEDGTPDIGVALGYNGKVNLPSGTPDTVYVKVEAETAALNGGAHVVETYNSSAGKKVAGLTTANDYAVLTIDVEETGLYKLYLGASAVSEASLSVKVNDAEAVTKTIAAFGRADTAQLIGDNWFGYELEVQLAAGENTLTIAGTGKAVALDYVEYTLLETQDEQNVKLVEQLIDAIGEVTLDSKEAIDAARAAYDALTEEEKAQVENYQTLLDAEQAYADLLKAQEVIELIDAIGEVTLDSEEVIDAARAAYDALTEDQKVLVTNYQKLLDAEHEYILLLAEDYALRAEAAAEAAQKAYEEAQAAYEKAMAEVAEDKTAAENAKKEAEAAKAAAEEAQKKAEEARSAAEAAKAAAEENRDKAAAEALKAAEEATKAAESAQLAAEYAAKTAEALAKAQEAQAAAEAAQKEAEEAAREAENARKAAEEAEEEAAQKRKEAEEAAEAAKEAARKAELANAKFLALYELTVLTRDIDTDNLNEHELAELEKVIDELTAAIDAAETEEEVAEALAEAKAAIEAALGICPSAKFTDVVDGAWYHEGVDFMIGNGYMNGVADTAFAPNADTTRGMMVTLLYRIAGEPSVDGLSNPFEDVAEDAWYTNAVIWAVSEGIVNGKSNTVFDPNAAVTRQEMVTMLWRYAGQPETEATLEGYTDAGSVGNFAAVAMAWAVENGIITGVTDTELAPAGTATRAQIATVLMRYMK